MNRSYAFRLIKCWLAAGLLLGATWLLASCVPTSEPVTVAETRVSIPAETPTALATDIPITTTAPALLARWNASAERYELGPVDATTGQEIPGYTPLLLGGSEQYTLQTALSPDGRYLAAIEAHNEICEPSGGGSACRAQAGWLHLVDVANWQDTAVALPDAGWVWPVVFNADGSRLALAHHTQTESRLLLFDTAVGRELVRQTKTIPFRPGLLAFTEDGTLALAGAADGENRGVAEPGPFTVQLLDGVTLGEQWSQTLPEISSGSWCTAACETFDHERRVVSWQPGLVASPDGRFLYIVHADEDKLTTVDLHGRTVQTVLIQAEQSWLERLLAWTAQPVVAKSLGDGATKTVVLSPDGNQLYVSGSTWSVETNEAGEPLIQTEYLGLQVVDAADGRLLNTKETTAERLRLTPDGKYLLLDGWDERGRWFEVWQAGTLEMITRLENREVTAVPLLDGNYALLAGAADGYQLYLSLMAPPRFKCAPVWMAEGPITWVTRE